MAKTPPRRKAPSATELRVTQPSILIDFLLQKMGGMSRTSVKQLLSQRRVSVDGHIETRHDTALQAGQTVSISNDHPSAELTHPKLRIVWEDEHLVVVEKREGLLTVATHPGSAETTVFSILKSHIRRSNPRGGIYTVHRLDRETSGLLVFAKTKELQEYMREWWKDLVTRRTYVAVAEGKLPQQEGTIRTWLTEDKRNAVVYSSPVDDGGKLSVTHYKVLSESTPNDKGNIYSLVELNLETGRTNQIRVHLASIGCPVAGDRKYGSGQECTLDRLALHARVLELVHPVTEQVLHFETPVPKAFEHITRKRS